MRSTLLPLPGARTEEVLGASRGWEPGGRATPSDCSDSLCFGQFPTEPPKSVHKEGNTSRPGQGATAKGTPKFTPGIPFPCKVLAPRPGARAQAPLLGSHCRRFRGRPAFLHRGGRGRGALGRQTGGLGGGRGCPPHWKAWNPPSQRPSWSIFQEEEVSPRCPGLFSETERRNWPHVPVTTLSAQHQRGQRQPSRSRQRSSGNA